MKNNEITTINENTIKDKIYVIRGLPVMLVRDLALIFGYSTMRLNEQVRRNIEKFPDDMMFKLSKYEYGNLISQNAISSWGGVRKLPYAFTKQGAYLFNCE